MASGKVLSLGQCAADHYSISRLLREQLGAEVVAVDTPREALDELRRQPFALVLVNRALNFGGSGLEFIGRLGDSSGNVTLQGIFLRAELNY